MVRKKRPVPKKGRDEGAAPPAESVVESVIRRIRLNIRNGGYAPGQRLIEADVQQMTGASRGPVREAIRRLSAEGLLEVLHQKGARIRKLTREEVEGLYDVREVIEGLAASGAAKQFRNPDFKKQLETLDRQFVQNYDGSAQTYMEYNERFHEFIVKQSNNAYLERLVQNLQVPIVMLRLFSFIDRPFVERAHREHLEITKYLLRGDSAQAEKAMRKHVRMTKETVLSKAMLLSG
jgi:DNA-binding GntR family transcriptional regulator